MMSAAEQFSQENIFIERARIVARSKGAWVVVAGRRRAKARRATMCLVRPELGDRVLVAWGGDADCHVIGVLEREVETETAIVVEGDAVLSATGRLDVVGEERVDISSKRVDVTAAESHIAVRTLEVFAGAIEGRAQSLRSCIAEVNSVFNSVVSRMKRSMRTVEELDQVRAGNIDMRADKLGRLHAGDTVFTADRLVKVDGEQVHIG